MVEVPLVDELLEVEPDVAPDVEPAVAELPDEPVVESVLLWTAEAFVVAVVPPSRQARIPPSESMAATLAAVAATRARWARGVRRERSKSVME